MIPDHTNTGRYLLARRTAFEGRSVHDTIAVYMVWGMKKTDMTNCHPSNVNCIDPTKWDTSFNLESEDVQLALLVRWQHLCDDYIPYGHRITVFCGYSVLWPVYLQYGEQMV